MTYYAAACIVSRTADLDYLSGNLPHEDRLYMCCSEMTYTEALARGLKAVFLDERIIHEEYSDINYWGYQAQLGTIKEHSQESPEHEFLCTYFFDIKCLFIQSVKYIRVLERLFRGLECPEILIPDHPSLILLRIVCRQIYSGTKKVTVFKSTEPSLSGPGLSQRLKELFQGILAGVFNLLAETVLRTDSRNKMRVVASGALHHVGEVAERLQASGKLRLIFCENRFSLEKAIFCLRKGIVYFTFRRPVRIQNPFQNCLWEEKPQFRYRDYELTSLFQDIFRNLDLFDFKSNGFKPARLESFFRIYRIGGVVLDEDMSIRRLWAVLCRKFKKTCFVISHGIPLIPIKESGRLPLPFYYFSAETFINSEYEKASYEKIFYDPARLLLTGVPRYDRFFRIEHVKRPRTGKILFCAATMIPYNFAELSAAWDLLGTHSLSGDYTARYVEDLLSCLRDKAGVKLMIKPHYSDGDIWTRLLSRLGADESMSQLCAFNDDMLELLVQADLVVTTPSTVISEALMLDKDILLLNYDGDPEIIREYADRGVVLTASSLTELKSCLKSYFNDPDCKRRLAESRKKNRDFFIAFTDGNNTDRVVSRIKHVFENAASDPPPTASFSTPAAGL